jgi:hypothetical protein
VSQDQEPELEDVIGEILDAHAAELRVALPAKVVKYDATKQIVDVQIQVRDAYLDGDDVTVRTFPILPRVPVVFPRGGGFFLAFPLVAGDTGLLVFNDLPIDKWRSSGQESHPGDVRRHGLGGAVFLPGLVHGKADALPTSVGSDLVVGKVGGSEIHLKASGEIHLGSNAAAEFVAQAAKTDARIAQLRTDLSTLKTAIGAGFTAVGAGALANGPAGKTAFDSASAAVPVAAASVAAAKVKAD